MNFKTALIIFLVLIIILLLVHDKISYVLDRYLFYKMTKLSSSPKKRNLLLVSNSKEKEFGKEYYFEHCKSIVVNFLKEFDVKKVLFIPYAGANTTPLGVPMNPDEYTAIVRDEVFRPLGIEVQSIDEFRHLHHKQYEILNAQCIFVAGGNAFKLMRELEKHDLADSIHRAVFSGVPYIGCSSGVVVANPSLHTSRSIPIVNLASYKALNLIPFYINVHYYDALGTRLNQYLLQNPKGKILAISEGCVVHISGDEGELSGFGSAELIENMNGVFLRQPVATGTNISALLRN